MRAIDARVGGGGQSQCAGARSIRGGGGGDNNTTVQPDPSLRCLSVRPRPSLSCSPSVRRPLYLVRALPSSLGRSCTPRSTHATRHRPSATLIYLQHHYNTRHYLAASPSHLFIIIARSLSVRPFVLCAFCLVFGRGPKTLVV